jgi:hypothetical protein
MYKVVWSCGPWDNHSEEFSDYNRMQEFYHLLWLDSAVKYACKYELVAMGSFSR